jgi:hypothetical protein
MNDGVGALGWVLFLFLLLFYCFALYRLRGARNVPPPPPAPLSPPSVQLVLPVSIDITSAPRTSRYVSTARIAKTRNDDDDDDDI